MSEVWYLLLYFYFAGAYILQFNKLPWVSAEILDVELLNSVEIVKEYGDF